MNRSIALSLALLAAGCGEGVAPFSGSRLTLDADEGHAVLHLWPAPAEDPNHCPPMDPAVVARWNGVALERKSSDGHVVSGGGQFCVGPVWMLDGNVPHQREDILELTDGRTRIEVRFTRPTATARWAQPFDGVMRFDPATRLPIEVDASPAGTIGHAIVAPEAAQAASLSLLPKEHSYLLSSESKSGDYTLPITFAATVTPATCVGVASCRVQLAVDAGKLNLRIER